MIWITHHIVDLFEGNRRISYLSHQSQHLRALVRQRIGEFGIKSDRDMNNTSNTTHMSAKEECKKKIRFLDWHYVTEKLDQNFNGASILRWFGSSWHVILVDNILFFTVHHLNLLFAIAFSRSPCYVADLCGQMGCLGTLNISLYHQQ